MQPLILSLARRLMRCPAAPYYETAVAAEVLRICEEHGLERQLDPYGNILVSLRRAPKLRPLVLAAHLDHPGFVLRRRCRAGFEGEFLGGVGDAYFKAGTKLRLEPGGLPARLGQRLSKTERLFELKSTPPAARKTAAAPPRFAVWDLPAFDTKAGLIHGRACDDLIGVAVILAVLITLKRRRAPVNVIGALTRAEEVGFHGALALAHSALLPKKSLTISLETSRELPPVKMGQGVILRVGDRSSIFSSAATRFLSEIAAELAQSSPRFRSQRALMSGGTCEATAYQEYGYECAAVCVALGNYHNCAARDQIKAEYVSASDAASMGKLLAAAAASMIRLEKLARRLPKRLEKMRRKAVRELVRQKLPIR